MNNLLKEEDKISFAEFQDFSHDYHFREKFPNLRFGQAFMNHFFPNVSCPELFYMENRKDAVQYIFNNFIDWSREE